LSDATARSVRRVAIENFCQRAKTERANVRAERLEIAERRGSIPVDAKMGECEGTE
jgi:hypothetical protein